MVTYDLDHETGILAVTPEEPLEATDFEKIAHEVDPYIEEQGQLKGLLLRAESFPGWENFAGLLSHLKFVREHHRAIKRVAAVSDSQILTIMPHIVDHFVKAEVRHFSLEDEQAAIDWLKAD